MNPPPPARHAPESGRHIPALDGVRGLAVLLVFFDHFGGGAKSSNFFVHAFGVAVTFGWVGVTLFFVLSGFLITGILRVSQDKLHWWKRFFFRRCLRIFPLYYFALALILVTTFFWHTSSAAIRPLLVYALYLQNYDSIPHDLLGLSPLPAFHFWSLAVEEQFYIVWPFLLLAARRLRHPGLLPILVFAGSLVFRLATVAHPLVGATPSRVGELAVGAWLAIVLPRHPDLIRKIRHGLVPAFWIITAITLACAWSARSFGEAAPLMYIIGLAVLPMSCALIILGCLRPGRIQKSFSNPALRHLGTRSYGIYVYHLLLLPVSDWFVLKCAPNASIKVSLALQLPIAAVVTLVAAEISYLCLEQPILKLKDRSALAT